MSYYCKRGTVPHKRHTQFRQPDGTLYHEELMGTRGFSGIQSLLYHLRPLPRSTALTTDAVSRFRSPNKGRCVTASCAPAIFPAWRCG